MKRILVFVIVLLFTIQNLFQQDKEKDLLLSKKQEIEKEIELTTKLLDDTRNKRNNSITELRLLKKRINQRNDLIRQIKSDIVTIDKEIESNQNTLNSYSADLVKVKKEYASLIYHAFKNRSSELNFMYLLASENINQFYIRLKYLQQYKDYRLKQLALIKRLNQVIEIKINELSYQKHQKIEIINQELSERANLVNESQEADRIISILQQKEGDLKKQLEEKRKIARKLENEIEKLIKKEAKKTNFAALTPSDKIISDDFSKNMGRLPWPTQQGVITDKFGEHPHPVISGLMVRNNGIDISTIPGAYARAIFKGEISKIFTIKGANSTVIIRHGNYYTVYHNLTEVKVKVGDIISTKQYLGKVFTDVSSNETLIHFEIWKELEKQNPELWLSN